MHLICLGLGFGDLLLGELDELFENKLEAYVSAVLDTKGGVHTSMVPTFVFCAVFLYWYSPSFASLPFLRSTHSSTNRIITGSSEAMGLLRVRLETTCS